MDSTLTPGIKVPPPVYFLLAFVGGLLVQFLFPLHVIPAPWHLVGWVFAPFFLLPLWALARTRPPVFSS